jgi:pimeloyl-ACP methyl ester carboxylesterase
MTSAGSPTQVRAEPWGQVGSTTRGGRRVSWRDSGGEGPVVLLVMGLGADSTKWAAHVGDWSQHFRCVGVDNAGTGGTEAMRPLRTADMADDCAAVIDALELERPAAVGISMGGAIVQEFALRHAGKLKGQVLVGTWAAATPYMRMAFSHLAQLQATCQPEVFVRSLQLFIWGSDWVDSHATELDTELHVSGSPMSPVEFGAQVDACLAHDTRPLLGKLQIPTLVTHGTEDRLVPVAAGRSLSNAIAGSHLVEFTGLAHAHHWEALKQFNDLVAQWIGDLP